MKKLFSLLVALCCSFSFASCSNNNVESESTNEALANGLYYTEIEDDTTGNSYMGFVDENNIPNGYGVMYYASGDMYEGNFENGKKQGTGTMYFDTACTYIGEWNNDMMEGSGYMYWPMGDYFYGEWKNGTFVYGTKYFLQPDAPVDGTVDQKYCIYHGSFENGLMSGFGTMKWPSGDYYVGSWSQGMRCGYGTIYWPADDDAIEQYAFTGNFSLENNGWIDGEGTMFYRDGRIVSGTWLGTEKVG